MDFQIGTRVGELVVLTKEDMLDNEVYIHKMEIVVEEKVEGKYNRIGYKIVEYVKHDISSGYRTIPLTDKALKILEEVKKLSEGHVYLFTQSNGERLTSRSFNYWLWKYCWDAGISFKSSHCIRRTFASRLFAAGMPLAEISVYMGHEDIETTKGYIYNYYEVEQNRSYMNKVL
jgi:integrase